MSICLKIDNASLFEPILSEAVYFVIQRVSFSAPEMSMMEGFAISLGLLLIHARNGTRRKESSAGSA